MLLTAPLIHDGNRFLPEGMVIETTEDGTIVALHEHFSNNEIIQHEGILSPGFVNAHCHLELSHMKDMMPRGAGLIPFLQKVPVYRTEFTDEQKKAARHLAYQELVTNGTIAVGDISNIDDTSDLRALDQLHIHTFIECLGFTETHADQRFEFVHNVYNSFSAHQAPQKISRQSIVPHAPYTVSENVFGKISQHNPSSLISIHNQETLAENEFYRQKTGGVRDLLVTFGIDDEFFVPSGKPSLPTYTQWLSPEHTMLFIHNIYSTIEDIQIATSHFRQTHWCFCPNANIYIENTLPDIPMFQSAGASICVGTDSYASNDQLSILSELATIKQHYPNIGWDTLLQWATKNGAIALNMQEKIGTLTPGKQPAILNIQNLEGKTPSVKRVI